LHKIGFGFVEIGSVTPEPQEGNPKPRVFRLVEDEAVINRYGFNSKGKASHQIRECCRQSPAASHSIFHFTGHEFVWRKLRELRRNLDYLGIIGVNLGKNKLSDDANRDYVEGVKLFSGSSSYLVINVSSPNTPGLRNMQQKSILQSLLKAIIKTRELFDEDKQRPIFLKLAPDLSSEELKEVTDVIKKRDCKIDGFIISNTTVDRDLNLQSKHQSEIGGLSGRPLKDKSTKMIEDVYKLTSGKVPIIGVGGISNGQEAYEKILAGASVVQIYTSFVYHGPPVVTKIKRELDALLQQNGYSNVGEAVGKAVKLEKRRWFFW